MGDRPGYEKRDSGVSMSISQQQQAIGRRREQSHHYNDAKFVAEMLEPPRTNRVRLTHTL